MRIYVYLRDSNANWDACGDVLPVSSACMILPDFHRDSGAGNQRTKPLAPYFSSPYFIFKCSRNILPVAQLCFKHVRPQSARTLSYFFLTRAPGVIRRSDNNWSQNITMKSRCNGRTMPPPRRLGIEFVVLQFRYIELLAYPVYTDIRL